MNPVDHAWIEDHIAAYLAHELSATERQAMRTHLATCADCQRQLAEARTIRQMLASLRGDAPTHTPSVAEAVVRRIATPLAHTSQSLADRPVSPNGHVLGASSNSSTTQTGADHDPLSNKGVFPPMQPSPPSRSRRPLPLIGAAVAVLLVIVAIAVYASHQPRFLSQPPSVGVPPPATYDPRPQVTPSGNKTPLTGMNSYEGYKNGSSGPKAPLTPQNPTSIFLTNRFVYIIGNTNTTTKKNDDVSIKWYFNGVDATPDIQKAAPHCCDFHLTADQAGKEDQILFQLAVPVATHGKAEIYYNGQLAYTIVFIVVDQIATPQPK